MNIDICGISKTFGNFRALDQVDLRIPSGELVALLGPSGSGKTTLLRVIAGLETPEDGEILFQGQETTQQSVRERAVGFVFQHYALFRHMTVFDNVAFGLQVRPRRTRPSREEIRQRVMDLLKMVHLESLASRYPSQLSGGQRQRVALARALAVEPRVLLLDEPFGALDARVRQDLRRRLRELHDSLGITSVFVTHDQEEALEVADRVVVMNRGRIEQVGTPEEVYDRPANEFVLNFLGSVNLFHARVDGGTAHVGGVSVHLPDHVRMEDGDATGYVRPHDIEVERHPNGQATLEAVVRHIRPMGSVVRLELQRNDTGEMVEAELTRERFRELALSRGEPAYVRPRSLQIFGPEYSDYSI